MKGAKSPLHVQPKGFPNFLKFGKPHAACRKDIFDTLPDDSVADFSALCAAKKQNVLGREVHSVKDESIIYPQCHLDSRHDPYAWQDTTISPANDVCVAEYFVKPTFDCTLSGPFDNLFLT